MMKSTTGLAFALRALTVVALATAAAPVFAQDDDVLGDDEGDDGDDGDEEEPSSTGDARADDGPTDPSGGGSDSDDRGPAPSSDDAPAGDRPVLEETVYVVQGKPFLAQGHFELTPQLAQSVNDSFTSHTGLLVSGLYHLKENVAIEATVGAFFWWDAGAAGPRLGGRDTDLTVELRQKENLAPERVKLYQFPYLVAGNLQWSPLYGKVNIQDFVLGQFNLYLSVGAGVTGLQLETLTPGPPGNKTFVELKGLGGVLPPVALTTSFGGGLRFYFTEWLGVRVEVRDYVMPLAVFQTGDTAVDDADAPSFDVTNLVLGQVGVSFVF